MKKLCIIPSVLLITLFSCMLVRDAGAASSTINPPFDVGSRWNVCQGYNNNGGTHTGASSLSLDLTGSGCDNSAAGRNIRAPFSGTVSWYAGTSGSLCVSSNDGRSIMLTHIDSSLQSRTDVTTGQIVGVVAAPGQRQNNGIAHLHAQAWSSTGCSNNNNRVPFDQAYNMRICGAPNLTPEGPDYLNNGVWSGTSLTAQSCTYIPSAGPGGVYRFWSNINQRHFYTASHEEAQVVAEKWLDIWQYEGVAFYADSSCAGPEVYRFWSNKLGGHFYTVSAEEKDQIIAKWPDIWQYEGVAFCAASAESKPVYRFWNNTAQAHFYTVSAEEKDQIIAKWPDIWQYEGVAFYVK